MKKILVPAMFLGMLFLMGCPLKTDHSIDGGSYDIPSWLVGKWREEKNDAAKATAYLIKKKDNEKGNAMAYTLDSLGRPKANPRRIIFSTVGDKIFLCAFEAANGTDSAGYYIYLFNIISNGEFELVPVSETAVGTDLSSADLKEWLTDHKDDPSIYDKGEAEKYMKQ